MSLAVVGIVGIVVLLFLFFILRVPIAFSMMLVGVAGYAYIVSLGSGISLLGRVPYVTAASYDLSQIPLFTLMGYFALHSGISKELYETMYKWLGRLPGGLSMATIGASTAFASICGSSTATAATIGAVAIPEMRRFGYKPGFAAASSAVGGTLGIMIPPSIIFVIYAVLTEESIGKLFIAGIIPGIILAILYMVTIWIITLRNPSAAPRGPSFSFKEKVFSLKGTWSVIVLFLLVIVSIYTGIFTATEAAGAGCAGALIIALVRRRISRENFVSAIMETVIITGMGFVILIGAFTFSYFMAVTELPMQLAQWVVGLAVPPVAIMAVILLVLFIMGCFMDSMSLVVLMVPILYPVVIALGFDSLWFGVMSVLFVEMGIITPPVGANVFVIAGVAKDVPIYNIFGYIWPFVVALLVLGAILLAFPDLALFLPRTM